MPKAGAGPARANGGKGSGEEVRRGGRAREAGIWLDGTGAPDDLVQGVLDSLRDRLGASRGTLVLGDGWTEARIVSVRSREAGAPAEPPPGAREILEGVRDTDDRILPLGGRGVAVPLRATSRPKGIETKKPRRIPSRRLDRLLGCFYFDGFEAGRPGPDPDPAATRLLADFGAALLGAAALRKSALEDPATSLRSPLLFGRLLLEETGWARETHAPLSLLLLDVDEMRALVLAGGRDAAREALRAVGEEIRKTLRRSDVGVRTGGQSFAILLPETDLAGATVVAEKIRASVEKRALTGPRPVRVSIGFASFPAQASGVGELLERAARALARSKAEGKNRWWAWDPGLEAWSPAGYRPSGLWLSDPEGGDLEALVGYAELVQGLSRGAISGNQILPEILVRAVLLAGASRGAVLAISPAGRQVLWRCPEEGKWPLEKTLAEVGSGWSEVRVLQGDGGLHHAWVPLTGAGEAGLLLEREEAPFAEWRLQLIAFLRQATGVIPGSIGGSPTGGSTGVAEGPGPGFPGIVGDGPPMRKVYDLMRRVARSRIHVLLVGETGTGKERIAKAIHEASERVRGPFITVDCGALAPSLAESELFGHRKGAFTDAREDRVGLFERAGGGTLFLDEVAGIPVELQTRLLRVLQEGEIRRVGETEYRPVDVRVIAASNRDLRSEVAAGRMREDLYHRLNGVMILVPPLRERREDIPALAAHFLRVDAEETGTPLRRLDAGAFEALLNYAYPGNIRELANILKKACLLAEGDVVSPAHLPEEVVRAVARDRLPVPRSNAEFKRAKDALVQELTRRFLMGALQEHRGNVSRVARATGLQRTYIHRLLRELRVEPSSFKTGRRR